MRKGNASADHELLGSIPGSVKRVFTPSILGFGWQSGTNPLLTWDLNVAIDIWVYCNCISAYLVGINFFTVSLWHCVACLVIAKPTAEHGPGFDPQVDRDIISPTAENKVLGSIPCWSRCQKISAWGPRFNSLVGLTTSLIKMEQARPPSMSPGLNSLVIVITSLVEISQVWWLRMGSWVQSPDRYYRVSPWGGSQ